MKQTAVYVFLGLSLAFLLWRCANIIPPEGGPRDETPPGIVAEKSTPNLQVQFKKQPIELTFDEWIVLKDVFNQVVISPPLEYKYELSLKRRTVRFEFDEREVLRPEATYTINFGDAIQDLTEGNPAENLRFVFSTGDFIDSLTVRGVIVDAFTNDPVEGALFMLYENTADTVVRTERPFYFARTKEDGTFLIENVKSGLFKGFALQDQNLNYKFDQALEPIGFADSLLVINDSIQPSLAVKMFVEAQPQRLLDSDEENYGRVKLAFSNPPDEALQITWQDIGQQIVTEYKPDTTKIWYAQEDEKGWKVFIEQDTILKDTIFVRGVSKRADFMSGASLQFEQKEKGTVGINPSLPIIATFNHPIERIDTSKISMLEDTLLKPVSFSMRLDTVGQRRLRFSYPWKEGLPYTLQLLPGALTDMYGLQNDSLQQDYQIQFRKAFGNLSIVIDSLSADSTYLLELMDGQSEMPTDTFHIRNTTRFERQLKALKPATYTLRLTIDWNANGKWDTGSYDQRLQPEPVYRRDLEQLRANWDLEALVLLKEFVALGRITPPPVPVRRGIQPDTTILPVPVDSIGPPEEDRN
jgi:hypothetical protein